MTKHSREVAATAEELAMRQQLISDPALFVAYYSRGSSPLKLQDFHVAMLRCMAENQRQIILVPRGHGKTTLVKWYIVWRIAQNPNVRLILIAKNDLEAVLYARAVKRELMANHLLVNDWGPFKPKSRDALWSNDAIEVAQRQVTDLRPTVEFVGSKSSEQVLGKRCDELIADDIVTPETTSTPEQREKQATLFNLGAQTSPQYMWERDEDGNLQVPDGIYWPKDVEYEGVKLLGTVFHPDDLYHRKAGRVDMLPTGKNVRSKIDPTYHVLYYDCWRDKDCTIPLWPGYWSQEKLEAERKSAGDIDFNRRYRNIAVDEGSLTFRKIWIKGGESHGIVYPGCLDRTRTFGHFEAENPYLVLGFDPSTGRKGKGTTWSAFVLLGVDTKEEPMRRYLVDARRAQMGFDDILSTLLDGDDQHGIEGLYSRYHYDEARIEINAAQKWLLDNKRAQDAILQGVRLLPHETQRNKNDEVMGVGSLQEMVKNGWLRIPYADDPSTREIAEEFIEQLLLFPEGVHDYALALWFAELGIRSLGSKFTAWSGSSPGRTFTNPFFVRE